VALKTTAKRPPFHFEADLESYLALHLPQLLSPLGMELLVIGRQVETSAGGRVDLLAIDANGVVYIIELKLRVARPETTAQLLGYRRSIKTMTRDELIAVAARGPLHLGLPNAFQRRFGHPLPELINASQLLMVIAAAIDPRTAASLLELSDEGYSTLAFSYIVERDVLRLAVPSLFASENAQTRLEPRKPRKRLSRSLMKRQSSYKVRIDVEWFWRTHAPLFAPLVVTFGSVYDAYKQFASSHTAEGLERLSDGMFGRQLAVLISRSSEWSRVYLPPGSNIGLYESPACQPSTSPSRDAGHWVAAYRKLEQHGGEAAQECRIFSPGARETTRLEFSSSRR